MDGCHGGRDVDTPRGRAEHGDKLGGIRRTDETVVDEHELTVLGIGEHDCAQRRTGTQGSIAPAGDACRQDDMGEIGIAVVGLSGQQSVGKLYIAEVELCDALRLIRTQNHHVLALGIAARRERRVERGQVVIAIASPLVTPVDMDEAIRAIAIDDKRVATALVATIVDDGTIGGQLLIDLLHPVFLREVIARQEGGSGETKIARQTLAGARRNGTAATLGISAIHHVGRNASMHHELCHGEGLGIGVGDVFVGVAHVVPVVPRGAEMGIDGCAGGVALGIVDGALTLSAHRQTVVAHHLRSRGGHTACETAGAVGSDGTQVVVGGILPPAGREQRPDAVRHTKLSGRQAEGTGLGDGLVDGIEPPLHAGIRLARQRLGADGQHTRRHLVAANHGEAFVLAAEHHHMATLGQHTHIDSMDGLGSHGLQARQAMGGGPRRAASQCQQDCQS